MSPRGRQEGSQGSNGASGLGEQTRMLMMVRRRLVEVTLSSPVGVKEAKCW